MTPISSYGEFGLIDHLTRNFPIQHPFVHKGVGDDAAIIEPEKDSVQVFSTDMLLEGVHFDLAYVPLKHLGYKAVVVNLSDIFAMNAIPYGITVNIAASNRFPVEALEELYEGMRLACERYNIDLLGGDTSSSKQGLILSLTAFGQGKKEEIAYRNGAKPHDLICVTGNLGAAYAGFLILDREKTAFVSQPDIQPDLSDYDYVIQRQLKPECRTGVLKKLRELGVVPTSMMDISDGLASELHHICGQSRCGATIYSDKLPIDYQTVKVGDEFDISAVTFALNGGEDYEFLFTVDLSAFDKIKNIPEVTIIGNITADEKQLNVILGIDNMTPLIAQGWKHF